ncbi:hypothetical protein MP638_000268, partial [Amoeboaphelidium occidentale]
MSIYDHKNKFHLLRVEDGMDLDLNMRVDENEMPKTFTTDEFLSMSMVEHSGVAVDVGDLGGIEPSAGGKKRKEPEGGKRCKCGSTEHQRISNKNCPLYKPRLKLQYRDTELPEKTVTTTTGLNSVLRIAPLKDIIMDAVARCTDIQVEVSRLLNGYVIWMIEENRPIPDLRFSDGIMREFYQAVCSIDAVRNPHQHKGVSTPSINEYMDEIYSRCRPDHLAWNDATKLTELIPNMARMHSTNCQNHEASWWTYLKPISRLLKTFVNNYTKDAQNRLKNGIHGRGLRLFSLTPISTFKQKFILIDTDALHDLMTSENIGIVVPRDKVVFRLNAMEWWRRAFNVDKQTTATKRFGFSISTNGVEYHQHNMKPLLHQAINDWGYDFEGQFHPVDLPQSPRVIALDPGRASLFVAVSGETKADVTKCSNRRWQEMSGNRYATSKRQVWLNSDQHWQQM